MPLCQRRRRIAGFALGLAVPGLAVVALRYDARGPAAPAMPSAAVSLTGKRILVVASPFAQGGSWHGLQCSLPGALGATGAKGLFVEASPASKAVFEIERWVSPPGARPRWWAIRLDDDGSPPSTDRVRSRLHDLGIDAIVTLEGISAAASEALRGSPVDLGNGWALYPVDAASEFRIGRDRIDLRLAASGAEETVAIPVNPFPDWRVRSGDATIATRGVPRDPALVVRGRGSVTLGIGPRGEEWTPSSRGHARPVH